MTLQLVLQNDDSTRNVFQGAVTHHGRLQTTFLAQLPSPPFRPVRPVNRNQMKPIILMSSPAENRRLHLYDTSVFAPDEKCTRYSIELLFFCCHFYLYWFSFDLFCIIFFSFDSILFTSKSNDWLLVKSWTDLIAATRID